MLCERLQNKKEGRLFFQPTFLFFHLTINKRLFIIRSPFCFGFLSLTTQKRGGGFGCRPFFVHALKTHSKLS